MAPLTAIFLKDACAKSRSLSTMLGRAVRAMRIRTVKNAQEMAAFYRSSTFPLLKVHNAIDFRLRPAPLAPRQSC